MLGILTSMNDIKSLVDKSDRQFLPFLRAFLGRRGTSSHDAAPDRMAQQRIPNLLGRVRDKIESLVEIASHTSR